MGRKRKIPKKLVVPTKPMVEEPLKIYHTTEVYLDHLRSLCARAETPTSLVEGKILVLASFKFFIVISRYKSPVTQRIELCSPAMAPENGLDNPQV